jgi:hypothetical protein
MDMLLSLKLELDERAEPYSVPSKDMTSKPSFFKQPDVSTYMFASPSFYPHRRYLGDMQSTISFG